MPQDQWLSMLQYQQTQPDLNQYLWMSEYGSMTEKLILAGEVPLQLRVQAASHQRLNREEHQFLDIPYRQRAYVREVIILVDGQPWVFGRTIIPQATLNGTGGRLKLLGERPLGKLLFGNKHNPRLLMEVAKITPAHFLYPESETKGTAEPLWARRSLFSFEDSPLMVQEVFLPDCPFYRQD